MLVIFIHKGCEPTCTVAEGGILLFGDGNGNIAMTDRDFNIAWVHKAFSGPVRGVAYVYDILHHRRQYIIAVGEETVRGNAGVESKSRNQETYVIKVSGYCIKHCKDSIILLIYPLFDGIPSRHEWAAVLYCNMVHVLCVCDRCSWRATCLDLSRPSTLATLC